MLMISKIKVAISNFQSAPSIQLMKIMLTKVTPRKRIDIDIDIYFRIVFNYVVDIFYHFTENDPRAIIGKPVFMTDLSVYFYMLM